MGPVVDFFNLEADERVDQRISTPAASSRFSSSSDIFLEPTESRTILTLTPRLPAASNASVNCVPTSPFS